MEDVGLGEGCAGGVAVGLAAGSVVGARLGALDGVVVVPERAEIVAEGDGEDSDVDVADGVGSFAVLGDGEASAVGEVLGDDEGRESSSGDSSRLGEGDAGADGPASVRLLTHGSGIWVGICHDSSVSSEAGTRADS